MSPVVAVCVAAFVAGVCVGKVRSHLAGPGALILPYGIVEVEGWVERIEVRGDRGGHRYFIVPTRIGVLDQQSQLPKRITLLWRGRVKSDLRPGDHIKVRAKFLRPPGPVWPGGYDPGFVRWFKGIGGGGFALAAPERGAAREGMPSSVRWTAAVEQMRLNIAQRIRAALPSQTGAIAVALATGDRSAISDEVRDNLRAAGLAHLLAISGLHMALFAGGVFWLVRAVLAVNVALALSWPIKKYSAATALVAGAGYLVLSGAGLATQRAFIMIAIMFMAIILDRPALSMRNVAIAALAILVVRPESLLSVSFQLSFAAVIALVALYEVLQDRATRRTKPNATHGLLRAGVSQLGRYFWGVAVTTLVAGLATAPVAAFHFNKTAAFGLLANVMAVPVVGSLVMPAAILALIVMPFGLEKWPLMLMGQGIAFVVWVAQMVAELPGAVRTVSQMPDGSGFFLALGMLWLCLWRTWWRVLGIAPLVLALALLPLFRTVPTILVSDKAQQVAVAGEGGELVFSSQRAGQYAAERWLLKFGDGTAFEQARTRPGFKCDRSGCTITIAGREEIALVRHPSILDEECHRAAVVITTFRIRGPCPSARALITPRDLERHGVHAVTIVRKQEKTADGHRPAAGVFIRTARPRPDARPWTVAPTRIPRVKRKEKRPEERPMAPQKKKAPVMQPAPPLQVKI